MLIGVGLGRARACVKVLLILGIIADLKEYEIIFLMSPRFSKLADKWLNYGENGEKRGEMWGSELLQITDWERG